MAGNGFWSLMIEHGSRPKGVEIERVITQSFWRVLVDDKCVKTIHESILLGGRGSIDWDKVK